MKKEIYADSLILGSGLSGQPFYCTAITPAQGYKLQNSTLNGFMLELQDRTGRISAFVPDGVTPDIGVMLDKVVEISGIVLKPQEYVIKVSEIALCDNYAPYDVILALSEKRKRQYIKLIQGQIASIQNPQYKALLEAIYTEEMFEKMSLAPVTLKSYGNYCGGVLAATATILNQALIYVKMANDMLNEVYQQPVDRELVLVAALLQYIGKVREYTVFPFKRTKEAIEIGRVGVLNSTVYDAIKKNGLNIDTSEVSKILSYVLPSLDPKGQVKGTSKEAIILQKITEAYSACDMRDKAVADYTGTDEIFFSPAINSYVKNTKVS